MQHTNTYGNGVEFFWGWHYWRCCMIPVPIRIIISSILFWSISSYAEVRIISHDPVPNLNSHTLTRIYMGKLIKVDNVFVVPVNMKPGNLSRTTFLKHYLRQDEDKYSAYWTVRRFIGKGIPPIEVSSDTEMVEYIRTTPGAIGYIDTEKTPLPNGLYILQNQFLL